jgi:thiopurine S-methyltransferase
MQPEFWHERWQQQQIGFHQKNINPYLQAFWPRVSAGTKGKVFVPLCGKSMDMRWLEDVGHDVVGVELSPIAARSFFETHGMAYSHTNDGRFDIFESESVRLYCGDFFRLTANDLAGVVAVFDRAALVALPPEMREHYAAHMRAMLSPQVRTLLVAFDYPQEEMAGPPFSVGQPEVQRLYAPFCEVALLHEEDILALEPRFREKGLTRLQEKIYLLTYNQGREDLCNR